VEVASIRASVKLAQAAFRAVTKTIESTFSENYLSGLLLFELQSRGADDAGFTPTVASAESSGSYWHQSNNKPMRNNAPVSINWGARVRGYCSDLTRTIYFGRPAQKFEKMHEAVLSSRQQVLEFIRPGVTTRQVDKVGRSVLEKKGFKADRAFGHGVGRDANELPILSSWSPEEELQPGMVIAIEPGIHVHGVGGVRIEDMVLVTHGGCEVLSDLDLTYAGSRIE
jgi:Xaa-Pro aminopeptidase